MKMSDKLAACRTDDSFRYPHLFIRERLVWSRSDLLILAVRFNARSGDEANPRRVSDD
jgi:hypothetical protein